MTKIQKQNIIFGSIMLFCVLTMAYCSYTAEPYYKVPEDYPPAKKEVGKLKPWFKQEVAFIEDFMEDEDLAIANARANNSNFTGMYAVYFRSTHYDAKQLDLLYDQLIERGWVDKTDTWQEDSQEAVRKDFEWDYMRWEGTRLLCQNQTALVILGKDYDLYSYEGRQVIMDLMYNESTPCYYFR